MSAPADGEALAREGAGAGTAALRERFGTDAPPAALRRLQAGGLALLLHQGGVRDLRWHGVEVLRGVSFLLRDQDWGTVPAELELVAETQAPEGFALELAYRHRLAGASLDTRVYIRASAQGEFSITSRAQADADLDTNRCGLVVLHPAHFAGLPLSVLHVDGSIEHSAFPGAISPGQPFFAIRELRYQPLPGLAVSCRMEAELPHDSAGKFEMEDQRNWSDASFKTYVGSLLDSWPYTLRAGRAYRQQLQLSIAAAGTGASADQRSLTAGAAPRPPGRHGSLAGRPAVAARVADNSEQVLQPGAPTGVQLPALAIGVPAGAAAISAEEVAAVRVLAPAWLCAEAELEDAQLDAQLHALRQLVASCGARLRLDLVCADQSTAAQAAARAQSACTAAGLRPDALRALPAALLKSFQPGDRWPAVASAREYADALRAAFPGARIGGGVFTYFTELNRLDPPAAGLDFIGHATCPIVHAADDRSVMETLESLPHIARTVAARWPGVPWQLGPTTIAALRNPYGQAPVPNAGWLRVALADRDPRHRAAFGAAWTAGYAAMVAGSGVELLALHHAHGSSGPLAASGQRVPAWNVLQALAAGQGCAQLAMPGLPDGLAGLAWRRADGRRALLLANTGSERAAVSLPAGSDAAVLHQSRAPEARLEWLRLPPGRLELAPCDTLLLSLPALPG